MADWDYGGAFQRYPTDKGTIVLGGGLGRVKCHDIFNPLPAFMHDADVIFTDPPWNTANIRSFYTKAGIHDAALEVEFAPFRARLFECVEEIAPRVCYIEMGKEFLADTICDMRRIFRTVTFYVSSYYHKRDNICFVVRGSKKREKLPLDYMDEEDIIRWVCANEQYDCIGDLCMGRGLVGNNAFANGRRFVGTELNHKRLSVLAEDIVKAGGDYAVAACRLGCASVSEGDE